MKTIFFALLLLSACSSESGLRVAATPVPHAELLEQAKSDLKEKGINLIIVVTDDYQIPNRALAEGEVDANFFQHRPFLETQIEAFHYPLEILTSVEIEPMGIYSKKMDRLSEAKTIAIPNDPSNETRALLLLQKEGLIQLNDHPLLSVIDIISNPKNLKILEVDAAMLPRTLDDVDLAVINTNFALSAGLNPKEALAMENKNSPYANIIVIRKGEANRADLQALKETMTSEKMRQFILEKYQGAVLPSW